MIFDNFGNFKSELSWSEKKVKNHNKNSLFFSNKKITLIKKKKNETSNKNHFLEKNWIPKTIYAKKFLVKNLFDSKIKTKHLAVVGHLHHGKTSMINCLASSVHLLNENSLFFDFSDLFYLEKQRNLSLQTSATTLLLYEGTGKSFLFTFLDCPGHPEFLDQTLTSIALSDGVIIVIDSVEGVRLGTEMVLRHSIVNSFFVVIVINSIDRLIIEFKFSPNIIQKKFIQILDELNLIIEECFNKNGNLASDCSFFFNPILNNVSFASFFQGWSFSLDQYAELYLSSQPSISLSKKDLVLKFWNNNILFKNNFSFKTKQNRGTNSMFIDFILIPLYKIMHLISGESVIHIRKFLQTEIGIYGIKIFELKSSLKNLFFKCTAFFFGGCRHIKILSNHSGFLSSINDHIPFSKNNVSFLIEKIWEKRKNTRIGYVGKLYPVQPNNKIFALTKILSGFFKPQNIISILTEGHQLYSEENFRFIGIIKKIILPVGRYNLDIPIAPFGSLVLLDGFDNFIKKSAVFFDLKNNCFDMGKIFISLFKKLNFSGLYSIMNLFIEPGTGYQLKNLYNAIRKCIKFYPTLSSSINKSNDISLYGTGNLYFECVIHDIKNVFGDLDIKVSNPFMLIRESIQERKIKTNFYISKNITLEIEKNIPNFANIGLALNNEAIPNLSNLHNDSWKSTKKALQSGLVAQKMEKNSCLSKFEANSVWCFASNYRNWMSCEFSNGSGNQEFNMKNQKKNIIKGFKLAMSQSPYYFVTLKNLTFKLKFKDKKNCFSRSFLNFLGKNRRMFHWLILKNYPVLQIPFYIGEILFPISNFSIVLGLVKLRKCFILSFKHLWDKKIFVMRITIPISKAFLLKFDLECIDKRIECFFYFDDWMSEKKIKN